MIQCVYCILYCFNHETLSDLFVCLIVVVLYLFCWFSGFCVEEKGIWTKISHVLLTFFTNSDIVAVRFAMTKFFVGHGSMRSQTLPLCLDVIPLVIL